MASMIAVQTENAFYCMILQKTLKSNDATFWRHMASLLLALLTWKGPGNDNKIGGRLTQM